MMYKNLTSSYNEWLKEDAETRHPQSQIKRTRKATPPTVG